MHLCVLYLCCTGIFSSPHQALFATGSVKKKNGDLQKLRHPPACVRGCGHLGNSWLPLEWIEAAVKGLLEGVVVAALVQQRRARAVRRQRQSSWL